MANYPDDLKDDFMQYLMDELNKKYSEYKRDHPEFARIVETQCEGKTEQEFEAQFKAKNTHCISCGEWKPFGADICPECGFIAK